MAVQRLANQLMVDWALGTPMQFLNALLPAGTIATVVPIAERAADIILLAGEPLPATSNAKGGKRPLIASKNTIFT